VISTKLWLGGKERFFLNKGIGIPDEKFKFEELEKFT